MTRHPIFELSDRVVDAYAALRPLTATVVGVDGHDDRLDDRSPAGTAALADLLRRTRGELDGLPPATDRDARLAVRVLDAFTAEELSEIERGDPRRDISHMACAIAAVRETIDGQDRSTPAGWAAVAARLQGMETFLDGWTQSLRAGLAADDVAAARQVRSVIDQLRISVAPAGTFPLVVTEYDGTDEQLRAALEGGLEVTRRANLATADWLEQHYLPDACPEDGVGRDRYVVEAAAQLGRDVDLDATYAWAWELVTHLRARMRSVANEMDPDRDLDAVIARLKSDPSLAAATQAVFAELMLERQHGAIDLLDGTHIDLPAEIRAVEIRLAAPGAPLGAWYRGPSEDLSRPGQIWWSLGTKAPIPLWEAVSTAYHEGFPGHHLQVALAVTMRERLSRVHRTLYWKPGAGEGWALYAERLMDELGFLDAPMYVLGYLASAMLRACRVVIDIGCHVGLPIPDDAPLSPGGDWSFEVAVGMLTDLAYLDRDYAESEVTRYLGWPGQAITYKIGEQAIVDLRTERERALGDGFDLKAFHADVLAAGAVGLDLLSEVVRGELDGPA